MKLIYAIAIILIILGMVFLLTFNFSQKPGITLLAPVSLNGEEFQLYQVSTHPTKVVKAKDIDNISLDLNIPNPEDTRRFYESSRPTRVFKSLKESIQNTMQIEGFNENNFHPVNFDYEKEIEGSVAAPTWVQLIQIDTTDQAEWSADLFVIKTSEGYFSFGWQYVQYSYSPDTKVTRDFSKLEPADLGIKPETNAESNSCRYVRTELFTGTVPVDIFHCEDNTELRWDFTNQEPTAVGKSIPQDKVRIQEDCTYGSLLNQLICRYSLVN